MPWSNPLEALREVRSNLAETVPAGLRPLLVTAALLVAWLVFDGLEVSVAFSRQSLRMAVDVLGWRLRWVAAVPLLTGCLALGAAAFAAARGARSLRPALRLQPMGWLLGALLALRVLSLWDPVGLLFPYLSLLWAPHASWAVGLSFLAALAGFLTGRPESRRLAAALSTRRLAWLLFAGAAAVYAVLGAYTCQLTMLHGDEAHYLLVSQSLLRDGDIDLSNNLADGDMREFRVLPFGAHRAPTSPEGRIYSVHPAGLSLLLAPFYQVGLTLWQYPRLPCVLLMAVLTAAWLALAFLWLVRLGAGRGLALVTVLLVGTTIPAFLFSTQLYSETPALLAVVLTLASTAHWQVPGGGYRALGRREPLVLFALALALGALPFLHPRYTPLAGLLGLLLVAQAVASGQRPARIAVVAAAATCLAALVTYNLWISGDWMGHLRPGSAWDADALQPGMWRLSLPGHWLHLTEGLLPNSPVYLLVLVGLGSLAAGRDRRLAVAAALYLATAVVNGLHPDWRFGFGPPTRFLVSALPALLLLLCAGLAPVLRSAAGTFVASLLACLSWDAVLPAMRIPELAYDGQHLSLRSSASYYPLSAHFLPNDFTHIPLPFGAFWLLVAAATAAFGYWLTARRALLPRSAALLLPLGLAALAPAAFGLSEAGAGRLALTASPFLTAIAADDPDARGMLTAHHRGLQQYTSTTGQQTRPGRFEARAGSAPPGLLASVYLPLQRPGVYRLMVPEFALSPPPTGRGEHLLLLRRLTLPAVQPWEEREFVPLEATADSHGLALHYISERSRLGYLLFPYSGEADMVVDSTALDFHPTVLRLESQEIARFPAALADTASGRRLPYVATRELTRGRYRVHFELGGNALATLLQQHPASVMTAVIGAPIGDQQGLQETASAWLAQRREVGYIYADPDLVRPLAERLEAPWWVSIPLVDDAYDLVFNLTVPRAVGFLVRYDGDADLELHEVVVYRQALPETGG